MPVIKSTVKNLESVGKMMGKVAVGGRKVIGGTLKNIAGGPARLKAGASPMNPERVTDLKAKFKRSNNGKMRVK